MDWTPVERLLWILSQANVPDAHRWGSVETLDWGGGYFPTYGDQLDLFGLDHLSVARLGNHALAIVVDGSISRSDPAGRVIEPSSSAECATGSSLHTLQSHERALRSHQLMEQYLTLLMFCSAQRYILEELSEAASGMHPFGKEPKLVTSRRAPLLRDQFYQFRSRFWWTQISNVLYENIVDRYHAHYAMREAVGQLQQEVNDYSSAQTARLYSRMMVLSVLVAVLAVDAGTYLALWAGLQFHGAGALPYLAGIGVPNLVALLLTRSTWLAYWRDGG